MQLPLFSLLPILLRTPACWSSHRPRGPAGGRVGEGGLQGEAGWGLRSRLPCRPGPLGALASRWGGRARQGGRPVAQGESRRQPTEALGRRHPVPSICPAKGALGRSPKTSCKSSVREALGVLDGDRASERRVASSRFREARSPSRRATDFPMRERWGTDGVELDSALPKAPLAGRIDGTE